MVRNGRGLSRSHRLPAGRRLPPLVGSVAVALILLASGPARAQAPASPASPPAAATAGVAATPTPTSDPSEPASRTSGGTTLGTGSALIPHDLSPLGMFKSADVVVRAVMIGLALSCLATWTILLVKSLELLAARRHAKRALSDLAGAPTLRQAAALLPSPRAPVTRLAAAALAEAERSSGLAHEGIKDRAAALLSRIEARAGRAMGRGTGVLATIGSTSPFVGLFGTVWGIMNAFIGISRTNTTNLAVVAPGIAEALLATACGLVAAIPAVVIYNAFARGIAGYRSLLGDASSEVLRLLSRDLDRNDQAAMRRAAE